MKNNYISVILPIYGCIDSLNELYIRLVDILPKITDRFEIIMVNDRSPDNPWSFIKELSNRDSRVKGVNLSKNVGQHRAISAGVNYAKGDWIVVMDCDLQDRPEEIIKLYNKAQEGYDIVFGKRVDRQDRLLKRVLSRIFHKIFYYLTKIELDNSISNFSIISQKVLKNIKNLKEQERTYPILLNIVGFNSIEIDIKHSNRKVGESSYNLSKMLNLALDILIYNSDKPLKFSIKFGVFLSFFSIILLICFTLYNSNLDKIDIYMMLLSFILGVLFINIGIIGIYISKIFNETKNRPIYLVEEIIFKEDN